MTDPMEIVQQFIEHFNSSRIDEAMELLAEDVFYHNIPMEPMVGREAVHAFAREFGIGTELFASWQTTAIAASGDIVLTERVDDFSTTDGKRVSIPLMGSFRVRDGLIAEWRDYFDLGDFQRQFGALQGSAEAGEPRA